MESKACRTPTCARTWRDPYSARFSNRVSFRPQPQYDVAVALASPAIGIQLVEHPTLHPNQPLALLVDRVLVARRPGRKRRGDRIERSLRDRNADHQITARRPLAR